MCYCGHCSTYFPGGHTSTLLLGSYPGSGISRSCVYVSLATVDSAKQFPKVVGPVCLSSASARSFCLPHIVISPSEWSFTDDWGRGESLPCVPTPSSGVQGGQPSSPSSCFPIRLASLHVLPAPYRCERVWRKTPAVPTPLCEYARELQVLLPQRPHAHAGCHVCE